MLIKSDFVCNTNSILSNIYAVNLHVKMLKLLWTIICSFMSVWWGFDSMQLCNHWEQNVTEAVKTPGTHLRQMRLEDLFAYEIM